MEQKSTQRRQTKAATVKTREIRVNRAVFERNPHQAQGFPQPRKETPVSWGFGNPCPGRNSIVSRFLVYPFEPFPTLSFKGSPWFIPSFPAEHQQVWVLFFFRTLQFLNRLAQGSKVSLCWLMTSLRKTNPLGALPSGMLKGNFWEAIGLCGSSCEKGVGKHYVVKGTEEAVA